MSYLARQRRLLMVVAAIAVLVACALAYAGFRAFGEDAAAPFPTPLGNRIPLAILGDSNSHSYHDTILLPKKELRGGEFRASTQQWTEILSALRSDHIYQGEMGIWGTPIKIAEALDRLGIGGRAPRKRDFRFNFSVSGAECEDLTSGYYRQAPRLLTLMDRTPEPWRKGLIVIHIGVNSIGQPPALEGYAREGLTTASRAKIAACAEAVRASVTMIRQRHPETRLVLVGMLNGIGEPGAIRRWTSPTEVARISSAVELFNNQLKALSQGDSRTMYFDQDDWFRRQWGTRDAEGKPAYRDAVLADGSRITLTIGDAPNNAVVGDEHAGTAWNALWAQAFVARLNSEFGLTVPPLSDEEVAKITAVKK